MKQKSSYELVKKRYSNIFPYEKLDSFFYKNYQVAKPITDSIGRFLLDSRISQNIDKLKKIKNSYPNDDNQYLKLSSINNEIIIINAIIIESKSNIEVDEIIKRDIVGLKAAPIAAKAKSIIPTIMVFLRPKEEINIPAGISKAITPRYLAATTIPIIASLAPRVSFACIGSTGINKP